MERAEPQWKLDLSRIADWRRNLTPDQSDRLTSALRDLAAGGPGLRRPLVGTIKGSRHHNLKELRPTGTNLRVLFAFDPQRTAVMLIGGDKTNQWEKWYARNVPRAERLYDQHLQNRGQDPPWRTATSGRTPPNRGR
jgi:hypothetical protein